MRLFTAIELPQGIREELRRLRQQALKVSPQLADAVSWVKPENLHLTLKFLGEVSDEKVMGVCQALRRVELAWPINLRVDGLGFFPARGPMRVVVALVGGQTEALQCLYGGIERALHEIGFPLEHRPFTPHVTLGRTRRQARVAGIKPAQHVGEEFHVDSFALIQSRLGRGGAEYHPLAHFGRT